MSASIPAVALGSDAGPAQSVALTVYNDDLALIRETRSLSLSQGDQEIVLSDVSGQLQPETVHLAAGIDGVQVLEQNYDYDLVSRDKLLQRFVGREITLVDDSQHTQITGILLSASSGIILSVDGQVLLDPPGRIVLPAGAADELLLKPTLNWQLYSPTAGTTNAEISYLSGGLSWKADYVLVLDQSDSSGSLEGWVTLSNYSGTTYNNASLKLVAGNVHRALPPPKHKLASGRGGGEFQSLAREQFQEETFFEYHLYDLQRPTTLRNNQQKQLGLLHSDGLALRKLLVFDGLSGGDVRVSVEFTNSEENKLGLPLPSGTVRVMKADSGGELQFVGEDSIKHTPRKEDVRLFVGNAFDVKGEVTQTEYKDLGSGYNQSGGYVASYKVKLKNRKEAEAVTVRVPVSISADWSITASSMPSKDKDAWTKEFTVELPADSEQEFTYSIKVVYR